MKRLTLARLLPLFSLLGAAFLASQPCLAEEPAFGFDGKEYFLKGDEAGIREYLTKDETFDRWTTLMSVRGFDDINDPRAYALKLVENAKRSGPAAQGQVIGNEESNSYIADFLVFPPEGSDPYFAEWNLMRVQKGGPGIEVVQYARRFYVFDEEAVQTIRAARKKLLPLLMKWKAPE